jgi:hypothetical protein
VGREHGAVTGRLRGVDQWQPWPQRRDLTVAVMLGVIGVVRETKDNESRVGLTPAGAELLCREGHTVLVRPGRGRSGRPRVRPADRGGLGCWCPSAEGRERDYGQVKSMQCCAVIVDVAIDRRVY